MGVGLCYGGTGRWGENRGGENITLKTWTRGWRESGSYYNSRDATKIGVNFWGEGKKNSNALY